MALPKALPLARRMKILVVGGGARRFDGMRPGDYDALAAALDAAVAQASSMLGAFEWDEEQEPPSRLSDAQ